MKPKRKPWKKNRPIICTTTKKNRKKVTPKSSNKQVKLK